MLKMVKKMGIAIMPGTLDYVPPWLGQRLMSMEEGGSARIALTGPTVPGLFDDVDPARAGQDRPFPSFPSTS